MYKNFFLVISLLILCSCQNVKDALTGKKYENSDEFLVIKKNPLVLPPNFNDLPTPKDEDLNNFEKYSKSICSSAMYEAMSISQKGKNLKREKKAL